MTGWCCGAFISLLFSIFLEKDQGVLLSGLAYKHNPPEQSLHSKASNKGALPQRSPRLLLLAPEEKKTLKIARSREATT